MSASGKQQVSSSEAPPQSGGYSQGVRAGSFLFLSGQAPFDTEGEFVGGSVTQQVERTLANLDAVARAAGAALTDAVRVGVYLRDLRDFAEMDAAYRAFMAGVAVLPARTTIQSDLIGFDVEIDAVVLIP